MKSYVSAKKIRVTGIGRRDKQTPAHKRDSASSGFRKWKDIRIKTSCEP